MKNFIFFLFLFLLFLFSCSKPIETSNLVINLSYCKQENRSITYLSDLKIFKDDVLYDVVNPRFSNNQYVKTLEYGNYRIDYKNIFKLDQSVSFKLENSETDDVTLCVDLIDYKKEKEKHTPFIDRLEDHDSYSMKITTSGCFMSYENEMVVLKEDCEYYVSYSRYYKKLSSEDIEIIRKFELELIHMDYGSCTTSSKFVLTHNNECLEITQGTCSVWNGYSDLLNSLFDIDNKSLDSKEDDKSNSEISNVDKHTADSISKIYYEIGRIKGKNGDYEGAKDEFTKAIEVNSTNADFYIRRGISKEYLKAYESAIDDYLIAVDIDPNHKDVYYGLGNCYMKLDKLLFARLCYSYQLKITPNDFDSFVNRAVCDYNLGNYAKVIADLNKAMEIKSDEKLLYYYLALSNLELNFHKNTIKHINKAIKFNPKEGEYYFIRAKAKTALKMDDQANSDFNKAAELGYTD